MNNSAIGADWEDAERELFTPEEIAESKLRVALIGETIKTIDVPPEPVPRWSLYDLIDIKKETGNPLES